MKQFEEENGRPCDLSKFYCGDNAKCVEINERFAACTCYPGFIGMPPFCQEEKNLKYIEWKRNTVFGKKNSN